MKRLITVAGALAALAAPVATATAAPPTKADKREAQKECRAERGTTDATREAFAAKYKNFGDCVSQKAKQAKAERKAARSNAARECREERAADREAFQEKYGANKNKRNAFGRCVSQKAKAQQAEQDAEDAEDAADRKSAAQECDAERAADREAFEQKYGTNKNKRNAFGKCVSQKAQEDDDS